MKQISDELERIGIMATVYLTIEANLITKLFEQLVARKIPH